MGKSSGTLILFSYLEIYLDLTDSLTYCMAILL